jgi:hypothetical protein
VKSDLFTETASEIGVRIESIFVNISLPVFSRSVNDVAVKNEGVGFYENIFDFRGG